MSSGQAGISCRVWGQRLVWPWFPVWKQAVKVALHDLSGLLRFRLKVSEKTYQRDNSEGVRKLLPIILNTTVVYGITLSYHSGGRLKWAKGWVLFWLEIEFRRSGRLMWNGMWQLKSESPLILPPFLQKLTVLHHVYSLLNCVALNQRRGRRVFRGFTWFG